MNRVPGSDDAPTPTTPEQLRNVVLVGPPGAGKSVLFDHLVAARVPGRRPRTDTRTSTGLTAASFASGDVIVNLIDTPGHPDFVGEVRAGLRAADAAIFVLSGADDVDEGTRMLWRECETEGMPRAIAVTRLEQARADFEQTVAMCRRAFGDAQPLAVPVSGESEVTGLLDVLRRTAHDRAPDVGAAWTGGRELTEDEAATVDERRPEVIESIIEESEDETLLERYLEGEEIDLDTITADLHKAVATARFFPILPTHATGGVGVEELLDLIERGMPSPLEAPLPAVYKPNGGEWGALSCDPQGPLVAEVVRTSTDTFVGRQSLVRVFSGTLRPDAPLHVSGHLRQFVDGELSGHEDHDADVDRAGALASPVGEEARPVGEAIAGSVVLVGKLAAAETTDTLSSPDRPALVEPWVLPVPLMPVAVHARSKGDEDKLTEALQGIVSEDVTMRLELNPETHQVVLWAMGPAHVDQLLTSLDQRYHVQVEAEPLRTALRETFVRSCTTQGRLVKQSGGHGQYAVCHLTIEPLERGAGFEFVDKVVGGSVPRQYIPSVEKGVRAQLERGVLAGYPVVDVRVTLFDGKAHSVDSSDMAFQTAAGLALREAANEGTVSMLEPIDAVDIDVADGSVGAVLADLRGRRGQVHGTEPSSQEGRTVIHAEVPQHELSRYPVDLRSVSHGTGTFRRRFVRYDYMPAALARQATGTA